MKVFHSARVLASIAAAIWLIFAIAIALPTETFGGDFGNIATKLVNELHVFFIFFLIFIDVFIGCKFLNQEDLYESVKKNWFKIFAAIAVAVGIGVFTARGAGDRFATYMPTISSIALLMLFLIRYWTYHVTVRVTPVGLPTLRPG
jgi:hypothetical protein